MLMYKIHISNMIYPYNYKPKVKTLNFNENEFNPNEMSYVNPRHPHTILLCSHSRIKQQINKSVLFKIMFSFFLCLL